MMDLKWLRSWCLITALLLLCVLGGGLGYLRLGTTVIEDVISPGGKWDAVLVVKNGGAMTGYATAISIVNASSPLARQMASFGVAHCAFVADDNGGKISWGDRGQIDVRARWKSSTELVVTVPEKARILRQEPTFKSVNIIYMTAK